MDEIVFVGDVEAAIAFAESGGRVLCPRCRSVLKIATTLEDARRLRTHPGIFCP